jgi:hypothetical protein
LTRVKAPHHKAHDADASNAREVAIMGTGEILFLILVLAAAASFAVTLAYYSRG